MVEDPVRQRGPREAPAALPEQLQVPPLGAVVRHGARRELVELHHLHPERPQLRLELRPSSRDCHHDRIGLVGVPEVGPRLSHANLRVHRARVGVLLEISRPQAVVRVLRPGQVHRSREDDPRRPVPAVPAGREVRVVSPHGGAADDHGVRPRALRPHLLPRGGTRDPRAVPRGRGDLPVDGHGVLEDAKRPARRDAMQEMAVGVAAPRDALGDGGGGAFVRGGREPGGELPEDVHADARVAERRDGLAPDARDRVEDPDDDARYPRSDEGVHRGVLADGRSVRGLQVEVRDAAVRARARLSHREHLRAHAALAHLEGPRDHRAGGIEQHASATRVRLDQPVGAVRQLGGAENVDEVVVREREPRGLRAGRRAGRVRERGGAPPTPHRRFTPRHRRPQRRIVGRPRSIRRARGIGRSTRERLHADSPSAFAVARGTTPVNRAVTIPRHVH